MICAMEAIETKKRRRVVVDQRELALAIGGRIRAARLAAGLTQQELAGDRYTKAYVSALELGHAKPSMAALDYLAPRLGTTSDQLIADHTTRAGAGSTPTCTSPRAGLSEAARGVRGPRVAVDRSGEPRGSCSSAPPRPTASSSRPRPRRRS